MVLPQDDSVSDNSQSLKSQGELKSQVETSLEDLVDLLIDTEFTEDNDNLPDSYPISDGSNSETDDILINLQNLLIQSLAEEPSKATKNSEIIESIQSQKIVKTTKDNKIIQKRPQSKGEKITPFTIEEKALNIQQQAEISHIFQLLTNLEDKLKNIEYQIHEPRELIDSLIPVILELLQIKKNDSQKLIFQSLVPVIDQVIKQRSTQDIERMSAAIANILPGAITKEINETPQAIAKAIAPEMALAIQEQINLEKDSIANALGTEMGKAIKTQIDHDRDAIVDALYPVIGSTISKYMGEVISSINQQVETTFTLKGIKRKINSKLQGVSEAELIFKEAMGFTVQAVFLIHKVSGLVIREIQPSFKQKLDSNMIAGMLTAIRIFVNDCIANHGEVLELDEIEYGNSKIIFEVAGYCYLAVVVKGDLSQAYINKIRDTLSQIILHYDQEIKEFDGDSRTTPDTIQLLLGELIKVEQKEKVSNKNYPLLIFSLVILSAIAIPWGIIQYRSHIANKIESKTIAALEATPELSIYQLIPNVHRGKLILTGKVPNNYLRDKAGKIAHQTIPHLELDNQIIPVELPPDPVLTEAEIKRVTSLLNQSKGVEISSIYEAQTVTLEGTVITLAEFEKIIQGFKQIPGVKSIVSSVQIKLPIIKHRIYFSTASDQLKPQDFSGKIRLVQEILLQNPDIHLRIIGHSNLGEGSTENQELAKKRASRIQEALINQGIKSTRLQVVSSSKLPPEVTKEEQLWLSRCVRFETFIPSQLTIDN